MAPADNPKRRSLLFPFAKSTPKETKFEVVNRKKNPAANLAANAPAGPQSQVKKTSQTPSPSISTQTSSKSIQTQPKPRTQNNPVSSRPPVPSTSSPGTTSRGRSPHIPAVSLDALRHKSPNPATGDKFELPRSNLDVNFDVPPVPDYNNTLQAPPVTIKGRSVSLTKKDAPPRRKPPTAAGKDGSSSLGVYGNQSDSSIGGSTLSFQSSKLDSKSVQEEEEALPAPKTNDAPVMKASPLAHEIGREASQYQEPPVAVEPPSIVVTNDIQKSQESISVEPAQEKPHSKPLEEVSQRLTDVKLTDGEIIDNRVPAEAETPVRPQFQQSFNDPTLQSTDSLPISMTAPLATPPFINASNNVSQADSFASASEFRDHTDANLEYASHQNESVADNASQKKSDIDASTLSDHPLEYEHDQEPQLQKSPEQIQVERGDDPDSSFEVQPLFFHRKTRSGLSDITTSSVPYSSPSNSKGHGKQLSLSDDILRDIEEFQSAIPSHVTEEQDEVSPVSPLAPQTINRLGTPFEEPKHSALYDEVNYEGEDYEEDDFEGGGSAAQNYEYPESSPREQRHLVLQNPDVVSPGTDNSLFQDSSDEDLKKEARREQAVIEQPTGEPTSYSEDYDYGHVGGLTTHGSRASSVQPEIGAYDDEITKGLMEDNNIDAPTATPGRLGLTDDDDEDESPDFGNNKLTKEFTPVEDFPNTAGELDIPEQQLSIPRSPSYHNISDFGSPNERKSFSSNVPSSQFKSSTSEEDDQYNFDHSSTRTTGSDQASSYYAQATPVNEQPSSYYAQAAQTRRFHVVNTGNYSDDDDDQSSKQFSYDASFDEDRDKNLDEDYSVVHQQQYSDKNSAERDSDEEEMLSFTAKSPIQSDFTFEPRSPRIIANNVSDIDLSKNPNTNFASSPASGTSPIHAYDRREDTAAPVQYVSAVNSAATRRPPPLSDAPKTTRVARSLSTSQPPPAFNYNTLQEDESKDVAAPAAESHEPEKSAYVEMLRLSSGTTNSEVSARTWGVPIGIADIDHSKMTTTSSRTAYKRVQRANKSDLKHGKIKPRLLASEVDDDDVSTEVVSTTLDGQSIDLDKSRTPSLHSPSHSISNFSPSRASVISGFTHPGSGNSAAAQAAITRSGTLIGDKIGPQLGRSGSVMSTVKPVNNMTLYIANPDIDEDD